MELDDKMVPNENDRKVSQDIINNVKLSEAYLMLARSIDVMEPKSHKEICNVSFFPSFLKNPNGTSLFSFLLLFLRKRNHKSVGLMFCILD